MKRNSLNFGIDVVSALVMLGMIGTGLLIRFVLPPGSGNHRVLWGLGRHDWGGLHFWLAVSLGALVVLHVALHWQWVCVTALRCLPHANAREHVPGSWPRNLSGLALIVLLLASFGGFVWAANRSVKEIGGGRLAAAAPDSLSGHNADDPAGTIQGWMTLADVANARGITVEDVRTNLDLPADVPPDERLGRLSKKYGFSMNDARRTLAGVSERTTGH